MHPASRLMLAVVVVVVVRCAVGCGGLVEHEQASGESECVAIEANATTPLGVHCQSDDGACFAILTCQGDAPALPGVMCSPPRQVLEDGWRVFVCWWASATTEHPSDNRHQHD